MSEPENISTQEKLDAWFASVQLDKPVPLTKKERFFRWCRINKYRILLTFIIAISVLIPIALSYLEQIIPTGKIFRFSKEEYLSFLGSYTGGAITLVGVLITIFHMNSTQVRQEKIALIDKEYNAIVKLISKMKSLYSCAKRYHTFESLEHVDKNQRVEHLQKILLIILENIDSFDYELNQTSMVSSILSTESACLNCTKKCNLYIIKNEFNKIFEIDKYGCVSINSSLYQTLRIKFYILKAELNIDNNKYGNIGDDKYQKINAILENSLTLKNTLSKKIDEFFSKWEPENFEKMKVLLNLYRQEQIKSISHPCPYKEN